MEGDALNDVLKSLSTVATNTHIVEWLRAAFIAVSGFGLAWVVSRGAAGLIRGNHAQARMIVGRTLFVLIAGVATVDALRMLGFDISVLLGAAGIFSVAIAFASQTTASNVISGLFLVGEAPFVVGDFIRVGTTQGEVVAIDSLSIKIRTPDNLFVRIPNELVIKSEVTNFSRFPLRRLELTLGVPHSEDLAHVRQVLIQIARDEPECLEDPSPTVNLLSLGETAVQVQLHVWVVQSNYIAVRTRVLQAIHSRFAEEKIRSPIPRMLLETDAAPAQEPKA